MPKVLVVDDSLSVVKVVEWALSAEGMDVVSAASGAEAVEQLEREQPDLVVCDLVLPDANGSEICDFVNTHPRLTGTPVLLISGSLDPDVLAEAARVGSGAILRKPFEVNDLVFKVSALLAGRAVPAGAHSGEPADPSEPTDLSDLAGLGEPVEPAELAEVVDEAPSIEAQRLEVVSFAPSDATAVENLDGALSRLLALAGVKWVGLADREGFLIGAMGALDVGSEMAVALSSCLVEACRASGRALGQGLLSSLSLECAGGTLFVRAEDSTVLAMLVSDPVALGEARRRAEETLPALVDLIRGPDAEALPICLP